MSERVFNIEFSGGEFMQEKVMQIAQGLAEAMGSDERSIELKTFHNDRDCPSLVTNKIGVCTCKDIRVEGHLLSAEETVFALQKAEDGEYEGFEL